MQHQEGLLKGYFAWSCQTDGTRNAQGPASDGELYYVTSLIFASNRWGNSTGINYLAEAQNILNCSMQKIGMERVAPLINLEHQLITFTPDPFGGRFTDPSYHIPAFYEDGPGGQKTVEVNFGGYVPGKVVNICIKVFTL
mgnify:CR=1 FL=1